MIKSYKLPDQFTPSTLQAEKLQDGSYRFAICSSDKYIILQNDRTPELASLVKDSDDQSKVIKSWLVEDSAVIN